MVLHPFEQPRYHAWNRRQGSTVPFSTYRNVSINQANSSEGRSIVSIDTRLSRTPKNEQITGACPERLDSTRINATLMSPQERRNRQWCEYVVKLRLSVKGQLGTYTAPRECKPFGKFSKIAAAEAMSPPPVNPLQARNQRRVRFNVDASSKEMSRSMGQRSIETSSSTSSNGNKKMSLETNYSSHRCSRVKVSDFSRHNFERLFWSRREVKRIRADAQQNAESFRSKYPATAKQVGVLFEDVCKNACNTSSRSFAEEDAAEDDEEVLRSFLHDWAASEVRGLEEDVTGRNVFVETRRMGVQGILAYQERLREQARQKQTEESSSGQARVAELIRARSESTSQRSRMFAMYMALGDALVVSSNDVVY